MKTIILTLLHPTFAAMAKAQDASVHVEMLSRPHGSAGTWTLRGVNGRRLLCPNTAAYQETCTVDRVVAPADCDWECQDGVFSGQGRSIFRGHFVLDNEDSVFTVEAAWDTWRNTGIRGPLYRIRKTESGFSLDQVDRQKKARTFTSLNFSKTDDVNFQQEPSRADAMLHGTADITLILDSEAEAANYPGLWCGFFKA